VSDRSTVLAEILAERTKQDEKWGQQNHPSLDRVLLDRVGGCTPERMAEHYNIPPAWRARNICDGRAKLGQCTWADILVEEVSEAVEAGVIADPATMREELVQSAAVIVAWIESIDRNEL
jgi:hypothetical protein